jgi:hypothetical protein
VTCVKIITFSETIIHRHYICYSREKISTLQLNILSLEFSASLRKKQIEDLQEQNNNAKEKVKQTHEMLEILLRYLFVKICHMFS